MLTFFSKKEHPLKLQEKEELEKPGEKMEVEVNEQEKGEHEEEDKVLDDMEPFEEITRELCKDDEDKKEMEEGAVQKERQLKPIEFLKALVKDNDSFQEYALEQFKEINEQEEERQELEEYQCLRALEERSLNRYYNILPFDKNRVELQDARLGQGDYINASYIVPSYDIPRVYIAAQGPLRNTIVDFWRTVVEQNVPLIVCLTPETEKELEKCARYWPVGEKEMTIREGEVMVKLSNKEKEENYREADCMIRKISVSFFYQKKIVKQVSVVQLQFLGWPDHGVPHKPNKLIAFIKLARTYYEDEKPILVHCSAGCGRTGTFCVLDCSEYFIKSQPCPHDPIACLTDEFRKQRTTMVQTQSQFNFCYGALLQFLDEIEQ